MLTLAAFSATLLAVLARRVNMSSAAQGEPPEVPQPIDRAAPRTIGAFLLEYWGERWQFCEAQLSTEQRALLEQPLEENFPAPWESVAPSIRERLRNDLQGQRTNWAKRLISVELPALSSSTSTAEPSLLSQEQTDRVQDIRGRFAAPIEALVQQSFDAAVEAEERMCDAGRYRVCPFIWFPDLEAAPRSGQFALLRQWVLYPWMVEYVIDSSEWPALDSAVASLKTLIAEREGEVARFLQDVPGPQSPQRGNR